MPRIYPLSYKARVISNSKIKSFVPQKAVRSWAGLVAVKRVSWVRAGVSAIVFFSARLLFICSDKAGGCYCCSKSRMVCFRKGCRPDRSEKRLPPRAVFVCWQPTFLLFMAEEMEGWKNDRTLPCLNEVNDLFCIFGDIFNRFAPLTAGSKTVFARKWPFW